MKICSIDGCERVSKAKGLCSMHYYRKRNGIIDESPDRLPRWGWQKRRPVTNSDKICSVPGCNKVVYSKMLCHTHYERNRRNGHLIYKKDLPKPICKVMGCNKIATSINSKLCKFHFRRQRNGTELTRPKGNSGSLNVHWNNGASQYPNHYLLKKNRLIVLEEANYICSFCGGKANQVHHLDKSKDNHSVENLAACCHKCNHLPGHRKKYTSKYLRKYGLKMKDIVKILNICPATIKKLDKSGKLKRMVGLNTEISQYLW